MTGSPGGKRAADYVAAAFKAAGLQPAGEAGTYLQSFEFTAGVSLAKENALSASVGGKPLDLKSDVDWRPLSFSRTGNVSPADVVFAGYGITAPKDGDNAEYDSYAHLDVEGKWVVIWRGVPNSVDSASRIHLSPAIADFPLQDGDRTRQQRRRRDLRPRAKHQVYRRDSEASSYEVRLRTLPALPVVAIGQKTAERVPEGRRRSRAQTSSRRRLDAGEMVNGVAFR